MYKKIILIIVFALLGLFISTPYCMAETQFKVNSYYYWVDGQPEKMDASTFMQNGRVYVPVRYLALGVGISSTGISWDAETETVILARGNANVLLTINNP